VAGDTIWVAGGASYACGSFASNGSAGNYITLLADSSTGTATLTSSCGVGSHTYIAVQGFTFSNGTTVNGNGCSHLKVVGDSFDNWGLGIALSPSCDNVLVDGNSFGPNANDDDINQFGRFWVIRNNEAKGLTETTQHPDFWQTYCTGREPASYVLLENNYAHDCVGGDCHFMQFNNSQCNLASASNGSLGMTVYIVRENKTKHIQSYFVGFQNVQNLTLSGDTFTRLAVYNNLIGDQNNSFNSGNDNADNQLDASPGFEKNDLAYNSMDYQVSVALMYPIGRTIKNSWAFFSGHSLTTRDNLSTCIASGGCRVNTDPLVTNFTNANFSLQSGSPAIAAGASITTVSASDTGSGTSLVVNDAFAFQDGTWVDGISADCISVKTIANHVCISSINYQTNTITLTGNPGTRASGDPVWLYSDSNGYVMLTGSAPDVGACPFQGAARANCK